jgi:hypothetical protein
VNLFTVVYEQQLLSQKHLIEDKTMSDIILAAIIGVSVAFIGSGIAGYISYRISKLQVDARNAELEQQLKHQEREARRSRLIETRSVYLNPLREIISQWVVALSRMIDETEYFGVDIKAHAEYLPRGFWKSHTQVLENVEEQIKALQEELKLARGQVHDKKLNESIDKIELLQYLSAGIGYTLKQFSRRKINTERIDEELETVKIASRELRSELQQTNYRIEELLVGDEAE